MSSFSSVTGMIKDDDENTPAGCDKEVRNEGLVDAKSSQDVVCLWPSSDNKNVSKLGVIV